MIMRFLTSSIRGVLFRAVLNRIRPHIGRVFSILLLPLIYPVLLTRFSVKICIVILFGLCAFVSHFHQVRIALPV